LNFLILCIAQGVVPHTYLKWLPMKVTYVLYWIFFLHFGNDIWDIPNWDATNKTYIIFWNSLNTIFLEFVSSMVEMKMHYSLFFFAWVSGWTKTEAIDSLIRKSGYNGPITDELRMQLQLTRYQSTLFTMHYSEYVSYVKERRGEAPILAAKSPHY